MSNPLDDLVYEMMKTGKLPEADPPDSVPSSVKWAEIQKQVAQAKWEQARADREAQLRAERDALRDQFAAAALTGLLAGGRLNDVIDIYCAQEEAARLAYQIAGEMLKARDDAV